MARDLAPKYKRSRREGIELHPDLDKAGTAKSPLSRRAYFPGVHGPKGVWNKRSNYGVQLREKQKAKRVYGVLEKQFRKYYDKAIKSKGDTGEVMLELLERRLDNIVYRLGFAKTRPAARQLVSHGLVLVNGLKCDIPSREMKEGDMIELKKKVTNRDSFKSSVESIDRSAPTWLDKKAFTGKVISNPDIEEPKSIINMRPIVEFYSR